MKTRIALWAAFVIVHCAVIGLGALDGRAASWDVDAMYRTWVAATERGIVVGVTEPWVYPAFALVPMLLARLLGIGDLWVGWAVLTTIADACAFWLLVGRGTSAGRALAAWFWLAVMLALGGVGMFRLDGVTVPLGIAGVLWLVRRPWLATGLLAAATWIKVWPAALVAAAVVVSRRRGAVIGSAVMVSVGVASLTISAGGFAQVFGFIGGQTDRGLQIEAPISGVYLWMAMLGHPDAWLYYSEEIITFQVTGPQVDVVIAAMTPILVGAMAMVGVLGLTQQMRGVSFARLFPVLAFAFVLVLIVCNKVGSPQYMVWLIPPVVIGLVLDLRRWWIPAVIVVLISAMTQAIFPWGYDALLGLQFVAVTLLTVRNVVLIGLLVWAIVSIVRVRRPLSLPERGIR